MSNTQNTKGAGGRRLEHVEEFNDEKKAGDYTDKTLSLTYFEADNKRVIQPRAQPQPQSRAPLPHRTMAINYRPSGGSSNFEFLSQRQLQLDNFDSVTKIDFFEAYSEITLKFSAAQKSTSLTAVITVKPLDEEGNGRDVVILPNGDKDRNDEVTLTAETGKPIKTMTITVAAAEDPVSSFAAFTIYKVTMKT
jgi:hypothetical protein